MKVKKILVLLILASILSGCATYKFQKPASSGSQGYLVSYDGKPLLEYTVGKDKSLPDLTLAKERFKRRRSTVEYYYKKMGQIEARAKEMFWNPPAMLVGFLGGVLRWPFTAVADYKYNRNPQYKARMDKLDEEKDVLERARVNSLKEKLNTYVNEDLAKEALTPAPLSPAPVVPETKLPVVEPQGEILPAPVPQAPLAVVKEEKEPVVAQPEIPPPTVDKPPVEIKPVIVEETPAVKPAPEPPVAVITAKPVKGYSPLKVSFSAQKSYSKAGRIVSYDWNFGDGDTSTKKNPENTYWSTTYGGRNFTATLTVRDQTGNTSSASVIIEVNTR